GRSNSGDRRPSGPTGQKFRRVTGPFKAVACSSPAVVAGGGGPGEKNPKTSKGGWGVEGGGRGVLGGGGVVRINLAGGARAGVALGAMPMAPVNNLPNPYESNDHWFKLPGGRQWGSTAGVAIAPDGKSVWAVDRCGGNGCVGSNLNPIMKFDANGNLVAQWG